MTNECTTPTQGVDLLVGTTIDGRFDIESPLREGGMGRLYRARDRTSSEAVALKVLRGSPRRDEVAVQRFRSEVETMAALAHPHVVRVIGYGELDCGRPYLAMELLEGEDLDDFLGRRGTATADELRDWLTPVAHALDALHAQGFVHRDVKPANIFRHSMQGQSIVKLVDFGLARQRGSARATAVGHAVGTPHYAPPELLEGGAGSPRSDVYSLASVAYELLASAPPFLGDQTVKILLAKVTSDARRSPAGFVG